MREKEVVVAPALEPAVKPRVVARAAVAQRPVKVGGVLRDDVIGRQIGPAAGPAGRPRAGCSGRWRARSVSAGSGGEDERHPLARKASPSPGSAPPSRDGAARARPRTRRPPSRRAPRRRAPGYAPRRRSDASRHRCGTAPPVRGLDRARDPVLQVREVGRRPLIELGHALLACNLGFRVAMRCPTSRKRASRLLRFSKKYSASPMSPSCSNTPPSR